MSSARDISWDEINKVKYYIYGPSFFFAAYTGTLDAFRKIMKHEGSKGLYKGFAVSSLGIFSGQIYITAYEVIRESILKANRRNEMVSPALIDVVRNAVAGGCASLLSQTIVVPIDVVSQKQMMQKKGSAGCDSSFHAPREILRRHGISGFYKGYGASLAVYAPSSALWWGFYGFFRDSLYKKSAAIGWAIQPHSESYSRCVVEAVAAAAAGVVSTVLTNPMDVARTRLQVSGKVGDGKTLRSTMSSLWREEGARSLLKGVNARILATVPSSVLIITVYELVKRLSLK